MRRAVLAVLALGALLALACASDRPAATIAGLTNPALSPAYSQWLIGPIARLATVAEVKEYLALADDGAAQRFIDAFWERRNPRPGAPNHLRELFDERCREADKAYSEAGYSGRRTDRGAIYVVYGPPADVRMEMSPRAEDPPRELWTYKPPLEPGLNGRLPEREYRFVRRGDLMVLWQAGAARAVAPPGPFGG
ncbi:MAG: GWxTD domain-containing protein [Acidobacteriota bacterium]